MKLKVRELRPEIYIPYVRHVDETTIALNAGTLMVMIALEGVSFETADVLDLNGLHRDLNTLYRNIADERLALWTHVIRRRNDSYPDGEFSAAFSNALNEKYRLKMAGENLFATTFISRCSGLRPVTVQIKPRDFFKAKTSAKCRT